MQIIRHRLDGDVDMVQRSIDRLRYFEPIALDMSPDGYYVAYSGGKDSAVIAELCIMAGVKFELVNNHTTVDPPELVYHVRSEFKRYRAMGITCGVNMPKETMWTLIVKKQAPPTRLMRYCCEVLKEGGGKDRFVITGVRWAESVARKSRSGLFMGGKDIDGQYVFTNDNDEAQTMMRDCKNHSRKILNPIIDWEDGEVWEFIKSTDTPYCKLYDEGFKRLGCIGCPIANSGRIKEFARWPTYERAYKRAFDKMLERKKERGKKTDWETGDDVFSWWMEENKKPKQIEGQKEMDI